MSSEMPSGLRLAMERWLQEHAQGSTRAAANTLSQHYAAGHSSQAVDLGAYVAARMPATFAAIAACLSHVGKLTPQFAPSTFLDMGAGPGTASHAAAAAWPSLSRFTMVDQDQRFAALAKALADGNLPGVDVLVQPMAGATQSAELVIAAYVLAELPLDQIAQTTGKLWQATRNLMVVVEPGTPEGYARIIAVRNATLQLGAHLVGPCTHDLPCPMARGDWCHYKIRLARSRAHMHAKQATVPFEDEAYSWIAFSRHPVVRPEARIVRPVLKTKPGLTLSLCSNAGLTETTIAARNKPAYKAARHLHWGDGFGVRPKI